MSTAAVQPSSGSATTALVLGIVAAALTFVGLPLGPVAWYVGAKVMGAYADQQSAPDYKIARIGRNLGIGSTVVWVLLVSLVLFSSLTIDDPLTKGRVVEAGSDR